MVEFYKDTDPAPTGPCRRIMQREGGFIREMVAETERTGKERIANIVETETGMGHTDWLEGTEATITSDLTAESMMDAFRVEQELDDTAGKIHKDDNLRHQVHTHPNGFAGLSPTDVKSWSKDIYEPGDYPDSNLIATMTEDGIVLGGLYLTEEITEEDEAALQRGVSMMANSKIALMDPANNDEQIVIDELMGVGAEFCSVVFPER